MDFFILVILHSISKPFSLNSKYSLFSASCLSCRCNLLPFWWYPLELFCSSSSCSLYGLFPLSSFSLIVLVLVFLCNQLSSDVSGLDCLYSSMSLHNWLKALCVGDVSQGRLSWKWPLWCGVSSITICRPFVWGCLVPPEKYPLISCLRWSVCGRLEQGRDLCARGLKIEQPRYRIVTIHVH